MRFWFVENCFLLNFDYENSLSQMHKDNKRDERSSEWKTKLSI